MLILFLIHIGIYDQYKGKNVSTEQKKIGKAAFFKSIINVHDI